jgi:tetratricopeptide (TPR) repeat protein
VLHYNIANALRSVDRLRDAVREYRLAAKLDGDYLQRPYYWKEFAGVLFLNGRFALSARLYARSLELAEDRHTRFLYADALLFAGQYRSAHEIFEAALSSPVELADAEWVLKLDAIRHIREETALDEQKRKRPASDIDVYSKELPDATIETNCRRMLHADALSSSAWANLGAVYHRRGDLLKATKCFLSAIAAPGRLEAWANTLALAGGDVQFFALVLSAGYEINGEALLRHMADRVPKDGDKLLSVLASVVDLLPTRRDDFVVRTHRPSGSTWDEVRIVDKPGRR